LALGASNLTVRKLKQAALLFLLLRPVLHGEKVPEGRMRGYS
jgi:hypothetical protein